MKLREVLPLVKKLTHAENIFEPHNPCKNYDTRNMWAYVENTLTHLIQVTHVKVRPRQQMDSSNPRYH